MDFGDHTALVVHCIFTIKGAFHNSTVLQGIIALIFSLTLCKTTVSIQYKEFLKNDPSCQKSCKKVAGICTVGSCPFPDPLRHIAPV